MVAGIGKAAVAIPVDPAVETAFTCAGNGDRAAICAFGPRACIGRYAVLIIIAVVVVTISVGAGLSVGVRIDCITEVEAADAVTCAVLKLRCDTEARGQVAVVKFGIGAVGVGAEGEVVGVEVGAVE